MYDVLIIGSGVIGAMIARKLSLHNIDVCIAERENDVAMGATKANSAIVHAGFDAKPGTLKAKFNVLGAKMMPDICKDLSIDYKKNGSLVIGFSEDDKNTLTNLKVRGEVNGVKGLEIINFDKLHSLEPNISSNAKYALSAPDSAIVCPYDLTIAAIGNSMDNGADLRLNFEVVEIKNTNNGFLVFSANNDTIRTRFIINAAGVYSDKIAKMIGDNSFKITPRRGEYMLMDKEQGTKVSHTVFTAPSKMGKGILVSPTVDKNLILGPTAVDILNKEDKATTSQGFSDILNKASQMVNNINFKSVITSFCGLRATGNTGDFIINSPIKNFINIAGIDSPGLSASPAIAEYVAKILETNGLVLDAKENPVKTRKSYKHFMELPEEKKNEVIKKDSAFGKICCRCENITEGEILHALRTNPKPTDLDGIKRRTRSQMGRCQGGFCSPHIAKLISEELGIPLEEITKCGGDSKILSHKIKEAE